MAFVFPPAGVADVFDAVFQEAIAMQGMDIALTLLYSDQSPPPVGGAVETLSFNRLEGLNDHLASTRYDAVIGTSITGCFHLPSLRTMSNTIIAYYAHHLEPWLCSRDDDTPSGFRSYVETGDFTIFTRTIGLATEIEIFTGRSAKIIPPSVNFDCFYPRAQSQRKTGQVDGRIAISAMVCPTCAWREPEQTLTVLGRLKARFGRFVRIDLVGASAEQLQAHGFSVPWAQVHGALAPIDVASLLNDSDIFIDLSSKSAMSFIPLEAMACGCAVVLSCLGGASFYAHHLEDAMIVDGRDCDHVVAVVESLIRDRGLRARLQHNAGAQGFRYSPAAAVDHILFALFGGSERMPAV